MCVHVAGKINMGKKLLKMFKQLIGKLNEV